MNKETLIKIDKFFESKGVILLMLVLLLVLIPITLSLVYTNSKLEEQIYERDVYIKNLQYTDSLARQFLDIEEKDSVRVFSYLQREGKILTYKDLVEENKQHINSNIVSIEEHLKTLEECKKLDKELNEYKSLLELAQKTFNFEYSIERKNDSVYISVWQINKDAK